MDKKLTAKSLGDLFIALDADKSKTLDLKEFCAYIGYTEKIEKKKVSNIDADT
jgi:hypothetical protein